MLVFMLTFRLVLLCIVLLWSRMRLCMLLRVWCRMRRCRVRIYMRLGRMRVRVRRLGRLRFMRPGCGFLSMLRLAASGFGRTLHLGLSMLGFRCMRYRGTGFRRTRVTLFRLRLRRFALRTRYTVLVTFVRMQLLAGLRLRSGRIRSRCIRCYRIRSMTRLRLIAVPLSALRTDRMNLRPVDHLETSTRGGCSRRARMCHGSESSRRCSAHHRCAGTGHLAAARCKALG